MQTKEIMMTRNEWAKEFCEKALSTSEEMLRQFHTHHTIHPGVGVRRMAETIFQIGTRVVDEIVGSQFCGSKFESRRNEIIEALAEFMGTITDEGGLRISFAHDVVEEVSRVLETSPDGD